MTGRGRARGRGITSPDIVITPGGLQTGHKEDSDKKPNSDSDTNNTTTATAASLSSSSSSSSSSSTTAAATSTQPPPPPPHQSSPSKESATLSEEDIQNILQDSRTYSDTKDLNKVLMLVQNFVRTEKDVKTVACAVYQKCMEDNSLAKRGAEICDKLTPIEIGNVKFRNCLLSLVQADYKIRKDIMTSSPTHYNGFLAFLCEIFNVMRTASGEVFKPLIGPIFDCLSLVLGVDEATIGDGDGVNDGLDSRDLDGLDEDSCDVLAYNLQYVGRMLEQNEEEKMKNLMNRVRTCIIHSKSSPRARCSLLEVLEAYSRGWAEAPNETTKYYCDMVVDIISGLVL